MIPLLFSEIWMKEFAVLWNADQIITHNLAEQHFDAQIGYGFIDATYATGLLVVTQGRIARTGLYKGQSLDWDIRADIKDWENWLKEGLGVARLGFVVSQKKLKFVTGDYREMLRTPPLATAFLRSFELMGQIETQFSLPESHEK